MTNTCMSSGLAFVGVLFIVLLFCATFIPLSNRMAEADFQSLSFGSVIYVFFPVFWTSLAIFFSLVFLKTATTTGARSK